MKEQLEKLSEACLKLAAEAESASYGTTLTKQRQMIAQAADKIGAAAALLHFASEEGA